MNAARPDTEAWTVRDVYLLTESDDRTIAVPNLSLTFAEDGVRLARTGGDDLWKCAWSGLEELSTASHSVLPNGRNGVVVMVVERHDTRTHRFVVPSENAASTEAAVQGRAAAHGLRTNAPPKAAVSRPLTTAVIAAGVVTLTVLLLSAAHVFHF